MNAMPAGVPPRYLRASYLAPQEAMLKETRATKLYYFPGPVAALILLFGLDYTAETVRDGTLPPVPGLTARLASLPTLGGYSPGTYLLVLFLLLTIFALLWLMVRYLRWITTVYAVTTSRVIIQRGILSRDFDEIPVGQVRGVDVHQTVFQRILGYGTVRVSSEGGRSIGNEDWRGIPKPFQFQRLVEGATQNLRLTPNFGPPTPPPPAPSTYIRPPGQA
ncbi:MAG: PH domain-containing protein [Thermoplasmata archaeon]|nr:PH domain-containing protein [Thermoplasmata archaeon]MCI4360001.1 PH domain-containing protein [Thermoplasmata archaeon]